MVRPDHESSAEQILLEMLREVDHSQQLLACTTVVSLVDIEPSGREANNPLFSTLYLTQNGAD